jgi:hypothetical protein
MVNVVIAPLMRLNFFILILLFFSGQSIASQTDQICAIALLKIYDATTLTECFMSESEATQFTASFQGAGAAAASNAYHILRDARARHLTPELELRYEEPQLHPADSVVRTWDPENGKTANRFDGGADSGIGYYVLVPPGYEQTIIRFGIEAHKAEHLIQANKDPILSKEAGGTPRSFSELLSLVRAKRYIEGKAIRPEWEYFHFVPEAQKQAAIKRIQDDSRLDKRSADSMVRTLQDSDLSFEDFLRVELDTLGYSAKALMKDCLKRFAKSLPNMSLDRKHADSALQTIDRDTVFTEEEKRYLKSLIGTQFPIRETTPIVPTSH